MTSGQVRTGEEWWFLCHFHFRLGWREEPDYANYDVVSIFFYKFLFQLMLHEECYISTWTSQPFIDYDDYCVTIHWDLRYSSSCLGPLNLLVAKFLFQLMLQEECYLLTWPSQAFRDYDDYCMTTHWDLWYLSSCRGPSNLLVVE